MKFASPQWLFALFLVPVFYALWSYQAKQRLSSLKRFISESLWPKVIPEYLPHGRRRKARLWCVAFCFLFLALARPQFGTHEEVSKSVGLDLMIVLDVSNSMWVEDVVPNRLVKAKHVIRTLLDKMEGDRLGLVAFAKGYSIASPLTSDYAYLWQITQTLSPHSVPNQGTDIGSALEAAVRSLERGAETGVGSPQEGRPSSAILLISDGEDHESGVYAKAERVKEKGIGFFAFGIGTEKGGPVPVKDESGNTRGFKRDRDEKPVVSTFHPEFLEELSKKAGGSYWTLSSSEKEVGEFLGKLGKMSRTEFQERRYLVYEDRFQIPLALSIFFFFLELSVPLRKRVSALSLFYVGVAALVQMPRASAVDLDVYQQNEKGLEALQQGKYDEAQRYFGAAQARDPFLPELQYNRGVGQLRAGDLQSAIQSFELAADLARKQNHSEILGKSLYNLGKIYEQKKDLKKAAEAYANTIKNTKPNEKANAEARKNLELLRKQEQKNQQGKDQEQKQDQNQQNQENQQSQGQARQQQDQQQDQQQNQQQSSQQEKQGEPKQPDEGKNPGHGQDQKKGQGKDQENQEQDRGQETDSDQKKNQGQGNEQEDSSGENKNEFGSKVLEREEAERVISELVRREKDLQEKLQRKKNRTQTTSKDW